MGTFGILVYILTLENHFQNWYADVDVLHGCKHDHKAKLTVASIHHCLCNIDAGPLLPEQLNFLCIPNKMMLLSSPEATTIRSCNFTVNNF